MKTVWDRLKDDYKKELEIYIEKYPTIGNHLKKVLKEEASTLHINLIDCMDLYSAVTTGPFEYSKYINLFED